MKAMNSAKYAVCLIAILPFSDDHFKNRSDDWWDKFWFNFGLDESQRIQNKELI